MPDVIRTDNFIILDNIPPGYYQLYKDKLVNPEFYFENIIVLKNKNSNTERIGSQYTIIDESLYQSIESGDVASISMNKLRVILSRKANHNTLLVTERCNNLCDFCSQPPKNSSDEWLLEVAKYAIAAFKFDGLIGISGGEPLLYGDEFISFLEFVEKTSANTALHVLTNGRAFNNFEFTQKIANIAKKLRISFGIPLYSATENIHNKMVGNSNAFSETVSGIINAGNSGINIELRYIPTKYNYTNMFSVIEMASRVFSNINQVSIMNLEATGWAKKNWHQLYIEPQIYSEELKLAVDMAERSQLPIALFNYPMCHLSQDMWHYSVQSISDWKNYYPEDCLNCKEIEQCGGYFSSSYGKYHQAPRAII
ncbi:His-Xaa-Ser system radical SAM maturase HxsC [Providencia rettgeri]|uniref:His-Xaa-Ser system radical SAM maturase HxsC n=1 Tax=Providencia rettgeri TaxID=587 RepID=UPI001657A214|nr:His-Xaa-Ser system radical SAM maturase HxsC [Providencia rettgeri]QNP20018.1 His-Xaa-Ser system radical SAM maturase HxsC [Providencia rettgeri]